MNVTNNSSNPLGLPGNPDPIKPGATVKVENWGDIEKLPVVALLLERKVIETGGKVGEPEEKSALDVSPAAQLAAINARHAAAEAPIAQGDVVLPVVEPEQPAKRGRKSKTDDTVEE